MHRHTYHHPFTTHLRHAETMTRLATNLYPNRVAPPSERRLAEFFRVEHTIRSWFVEHPIATEAHVRQCILPYDRWLIQGLDDTPDVAVHPVTRQAMASVEHHVASLPSHEQLAWWYVFVYLHMRTASGLSHIPWPYFRACPSSVAKLIDVHVDTMAYHWTTSQKRQCLGNIRPAMEMRHALHRRVFR